MVVPTLEVIVKKYLRCVSYELPRYNPYQYLDDDLPSQPRGFEKRGWGLSDRVKGERYDIVFLKRHLTLSVFNACEGVVFLLTDFKLQNLRRYFENKTGFKRRITVLYCDIKTKFCKREYID